MVFDSSITDTVSMEFWDRVNKEVENQATTQKWLASQCGVSINTFKSWVSKQILPNAEQALRISRALGVTIDWLILGDEGSEWVLTWARKNLSE
jgi:ribosome-binding protein aMBF1 (putative translation factor)